MQRLANTRELLDGELDAKTLAGNLRDLARVNRWLGGSDLSWRALEPFLQRAAAQEPVRVLDVGTGIADIPRSLLLRAAAAGLRLHVTATDIRPEIVAQARQAGDTASLLIETGSATGLQMPDRSVDVVHSSLLLHHLEPAEAVKLLAEMGRVATTAVIVNDLDRAHRWWVFAWLLSHLATANRYTRHDAPLSVRRAHGPDELVLLAAQAGLVEEARRWTFPRYRYAITFRHVGTASA